MEGNDGFEEPEPEEENHLVAGRASDAVQPLHVLPVTFGKRLLAFRQPLLGVRKFRHVAEFEVTPAGNVIKLFPLIVTATASFRGQ